MRRATTTSTTIQGRDPVMMRLSSSSESLGAGLQPDISINAELIKAGVALDPDEDPSLGTRVLDVGVESTWEAVMRG
eukprot:1126963-Prorocentrum_minimum.AAC.2